MKINEFKMLPQYGGVVLPQPNHRGLLIGEPIPETSLAFQASPFDALLRTTPEDVQRSSLFLSGRQGFEILDAYNQSVGDQIRRFETGLQKDLPFKIEAPTRYRDSVPVIGDENALFSAAASDRYTAVTQVRWIDSEEIFKVQVDRLRRVAVLNLGLGGLEMEIQITPQAIRTTGYVLRVPQNTLRDFIRVSLRHYQNLDGALLAERHMAELAANFLYHQQFVAANQSSRDPYEFTPYAMVQLFGEDFESRYLTRGVLEHLVAPLGSSQTKPELEIHHLMDRHINVTIRRPDKWTANAMPLRHNVLMLGGLLMNSSAAFPHFVDLMSVDFVAG